MIYIHDIYIYRYGSIYHCLKKANHLYALTFPHPTYPILMHTYTSRLTMLYAHRSTLFTTFSKAFMSTGLIMTRSAPLSRKWSMSCCIALPVTPTIRPRYPRLRIASAAVGPSILGILHHICKKTYVSQYYMYYTTIVCLHKVHQNHVEHVAVIVSH